MLFVPFSASIAALPAHSVLERMIPLGKENARHIEEVAGVGTSIEGSVSSCWPCA